MEGQADSPWTRGVHGDQVLPLINSDESTLRVPAGPGTGKTFGLRKRVLRLLHADGLGLPAKSVLVCAFNRVIRDDLRGAIAAELEPFGLEGPDILTIHGLAAELAGEPGRFLLPHEMEAMIYDVRVAHPQIDEKYGCRQARVMRALRKHEARLGTHTALATAVREWLADHHADLVGRLPRLVEARLRGGEFTDRRYEQIIIDEFQDLTEAEARLAVGLRSVDGCVVALGDKKQSIYAFRGNEGRGLDALPEYVGEEVTLMLFFLFPEVELRRLFEKLGYPYDSETARRNVEYYTERTSNGSTLSFVTNAGVLAPIDAERSWGSFRMALESDLEDVQGGTTQEGIHMGVMSGTLDLIQRAYLGTEIRDDVLRFAPRLLDRLEGLAFPMQFRGTYLGVAIEGGRLTVSVDPEGVSQPIKVSVGDDVRELGAGETASFAVDRGVAIASGS